MAEKTKLITQLRDAKNLIEQLEQDKVNTVFFILCLVVKKSCLKLSLATQSEKLFLGIPCVLLCILTNK